MRNGFAQADPIANPLLNVNPNLDKLVVEIQFINSINEREFIDKTPLYKGSQCRFSTTRSPKQVAVELKLNDPHVPVRDASLNINVKSDVKKLCKERKQQCIDLSFKNKKTNYLISRKLRN
jgi:hypothetical protein